MTWFTGALALLFIALKLTGVVAWSWLWVLSPLWVPPALSLAFLALLCGAVAAVMFAIAAVVAFDDWRCRRRNAKGAAS